MPAANRKGVRVEDRIMVSMFAFRRERKEEKRITDLQKYRNDGQMLRSAEEIDDSTKKEIASMLLCGKEWTRSTRKGRQRVETIDWPNDVQGMDW